MDNAAGTLLPISSITPELINRMATIITDEDADGIEPEWWNAAKDVFVAAMKSSSDKGSRAMVVSAAQQIEDNGPRFASSMCLKLLVIGWRMAELYLIESMEKGNAT